MLIVGADPWHKNLAIANRLIVACTMFKAMIAEHMSKRCEQKTTFCLLEGEVESFDNLIIYNKSDKFLRYCSCDLCMYTIVLVDKFD